LLAGLLSSRGVIAFWISYGLAHSALRLSISRTLTLDDARASELVQTLSLGYQLRQPPLYEWLLWGSQQFFGPGIESHLAVRYSLIALLGVATFGAVRAAVPDDRWAAAASLSLAFSYPVGWTFHEWATQTILLCIACMATLHAAIRFLERPSLRCAIYLGLALALGIYSKFSFPLFAGGLLLAIASMNEVRGRLADARLVIAAAIAAAAFAPFAYWTAQLRGDVIGDVAGHLTGGGQSHLERAAIGLRRLAVSIPVFLLPWILLVALLAPPAFRKGPAADWRERLAFRTMIFAAVIAAIGIAALGATNVAERYMHPILMIAPAYVFARVARLAPGEERVRAFAVFSVMAALVVFGIRFAAATDNPITRKLGRGLLVPYAELADALKTRGVVDGTLLSPIVRDAGNLRAFLPNLRVVAGESLRVVRPPRRTSDDRSCVLVWPEGRGPEARRLVSADPLQAERIDVAAKPPGIVAPQTGTWYFVRLDPRSAPCR
jgi:4-amino-4-deoxy-L-arabinose transferase-like glycosyltransferase